MTGNEREDMEKERGGWVLQFRLIEDLFAFFGVETELLDRVDLEARRSFQTKHQGYRNQEVKEKLFYCFPKCCENSEAIEKNYYLCYTGEEPSSRFEKEATEEYENKKPYQLIARSEFCNELIKLDWGIDTANCHKVHNVTQTCSNFCLGPSPK